VENIRTKATSLINPNHQPSRFCLSIPSFRHWFDKVKL